MARPRKVSPVTFNFRATYEKPSLSLFLSADGDELGRRPSAPECRIVSRAAAVPRIDKTRCLSLAEKKFFLRGETFDRRRPKPRFVTKPCFAVYYIFSSSRLFDSDLLKNFTIRAGDIFRRIKDNYHIIDEFHYWHIRTVKMMLESSDVK